MTDLRAAFLEAAASAASLIGDDLVAHRWDQPSALPAWSVGGLAAHLAGQVFSTADIVEAPRTDQDPIPLVEHYARAAWVGAELDDDVSEGIRAGGDRIAAHGQSEVLARLLTARERVVAGFAAATAGLVILVPWQGWALTLDDYLVTRMMEIAVHSDDLAASVGIQAPPLPADVLDPVLALLTTLALRRHGQSAVLAALSRTERAPTSIAAF